MRKIKKAIKEFKNFVEEYDPCSDFTVYPTPRNCELALKALEFYELYIVNRGDLRRLYKTEFQKG